MTVNTVESEIPAQIESRTAGLVGPLALFIQGMQDGRDTRLLRQCGENTSEPDKSVSETTQHSIQHERYGKRHSSQRRDRGSKHRSPIKTYDSRRQQAAKPRRFNQSSRHNGRNDSAKNKIVTKRTWSAPTLICVNCGADVNFTNETRCEDCFADAQNIWHGRSLRVKLETPPKDD